MQSTSEERRALVLYGSETGNAQDVAEEMGRIAERLRFDTEVAEMNAVSLVCSCDPGLL
jgi:flavodoxin